MTTFLIDLHPIVTAASCTTNCIAPVVKIIQENIGIVHGSITTIHDITNTNHLGRATKICAGLEPAAWARSRPRQDLQPPSPIFSRIKRPSEWTCGASPLGQCIMTDCVFELGDQSP